MNRTFKSLAIAFVLVGLTAAASCSAIHHSRQASIQKSQHMTPTEFRAFAESKIDGIQTIVQLRDRYRDTGFVVRVLDDGRILANREIPAAFPTSMWYNAVMRRTTGGFEIVKTEVMGKGL